MEHSIDPPQMRLYDGKNIIKTWDFVEKAEKIPSVPYVRMLLQVLTDSF